LVNSNISNHEKQGMSKMYCPNFTITNKILNHIAETSASREVILNAPLLPKWEVKLRKEAILKMAHHSTSIEGNRLTMEEVNRLLRGEDIAAWEKDKKEVLGYVKVLEYIDNLGEKGADKITEDIILEIHRLNTQGILKDSEAGHYRKVQVAVVNGLGRVTFQPPEASQVPSLMIDFIAWLNSKEARELYTVLVSGIAHYEFVRIHPFVDGNGRTARALATLILYLRGFDTKRFFALDDYYNEDRRRYYAALQTVDPQIINITQWLEYFTEGVAVSMGRVKQAILDLSVDRRLKEQRGQIYLNDRQMKILKYLQTNPRITISEIQKMFDISRDTANRTLKPLLENTLVKRRGKGRAIYYELA
jgi:Fic family protein